VIRTLKVVGIGTDGDVAIQDELTGLISEEDARLFARALFTECAVVEVWDDAALLARVRRPPIPDASE
jgi:hypothetical protein